MASAPAVPAAGSGAGGLARTRSRARERFESLAVPVQKDKGWEFTDPSGLDLGAFAPAGPGDLETAPARQPVVDAGSRPGVMGVDGAAERRGSGEPQGVVVATLEDAVITYPDLVEKHLGSLVFDRDKFAAQNSAGWAGGAFVHVPAGVKVTEPIVVTALQSAAGTAMLWRTLVVVEDGAELTMAEQYLSAHPQLAAYFNPATELIVGDGATVQYLCVQDLSEHSWVIGNQRARVGRDASLHWIGLGLGSGQGKLRMETDLNGRGGSGRVTGAYVGHGAQHIDYDTTQEHAAPDTTSDLAFRGILRDQATAVWSGMIRVDPGAQRTDAFQENRSLLLSDSAHADAIPGLEIEADDVRCTHAATISKVDPNQVFYLMSRGLTRPEAERLLVGGFLEEIAGRLEGSGVLHDAVSAALERELDAALA